VAINLEDLMNDYPSRKMDQFVVRFPDGMRERIRAAAEANNRSMNAEIVATLEEKYPAPTLEAVSFADIYPLMDKIASGADDEEQESLLKIANQQLASMNSPIRLNISRVPDQDGQREVYMTRHKSIRRSIDAED
jgi:hypothetical protein